MLKYKKTTPLILYFEDQMHLHLYPSVYLYSYSTVLLKQNLR